MRGPLRHSLASGKTLRAISRTDSDTAMSTVPIRVRKRWRRIMSWLWLVAVFGLILLGEIDAWAQSSDFVDIPALGMTDLNTIPEEMRNNLRIPGVEYDEPPEQYGDLPPVQLVE